MNKIKYIRSICTCLVFMMCVCTASTGLAAQTADYDATFKAVLNSQTPNTTNCEVKMGTDTGVTLTTHGGKTGWTLVTTSTSGGGYTRNSAYIYVDISKDKLFMLNGSTCMNLEVEYFDSGNGRFCVGFDSMSAEHEAAGKVILGDTKEWKTHTFKLQRPYFGNRLSKNDIIISVVSDYMSPKADVPVIISEISLSRGDEDPIDFEVASSSIGNIFYNGEIPVLELTARNMSHVSDYFDLSYTVTNRYTGESFTESQRERIISKNVWKTTLTFDDLPYGIYDVDLRAVSDSGHVSTGECSFSCVSAIYSDGDRRADFGVATHMYSQDGLTGSKELSAASRAGFGMIRDTILWTQIEKSKGVFSIPSGVSDFIANARANSLEPLMIISCVNKSIYPNLTPFVRNDDGVTPEEAEAIFAEYLEKLNSFAYNLASLLKGSVTYYEIGNEYNMKTKNTSFPEYGIKNKSSDYARIMQAVYTGVKRADPDAILVGGVLAEMPDEKYYYEIPYHYVEELYEYGAGAWMDCLSVHFYKEQRIPGTTGYKAMEELRAVKDIIDSYAPTYGQKELWVTEYGWSVPGHADTEWIQSENLVKSQVLFARDSLPDKSFWYGYDGGVAATGGNSKTGYQMLSSYLNTYNNNHTPGGASSAYAACANYNKIMVNCIYKHNMSSGNRQEHVFRDISSGKDVYVIWALEDEERFDISVGNEDMVISDIFGNITEPVINDGILSVNAGTTPLYIIDDPGRDTLSLIKDDLKRVRFKGSYVANESVNIAVAVLKPGMTRTDFDANPFNASIYLDQFATDNEGRFNELISFEGKSGTYTVLYGAQGFGIEELKITWYKTPFDTEFVITQNNTAVSELADFDPSKDFDINIKLYNGRGLDSECVFITAFYSGDCLVDVKTMNASAVSSVSTMSFSYQEPLRLPADAAVDEIKFMMIDSFSNLIPLASAGTIR